MRFGTVLFALALSMSGEAASAQEAPRTAPAFLAEQSAGGLGVAALMGADVYNGAGDNIGEVTDIIVSPGGSIEAVVIDAAGIAGKTIAVPFAALRFVRDGDDAGRIQLDATSAELKAAPAFKPRD